MTCTIHVYIRMYIHVYVRMCESVYILVLPINIMHMLPGLLVDWYAQCSTWRTCVFASSDIGSFFTLAENHC